ncbi:MAG TPA: NAD(P)-binding protein [Rhizomicrobium sp.]|nr:NAD(P)-binding protein [Rhizomicrobium sp.]
MSSEARQTISWRDERPIFVKRAAPCQSGCPAGENIREWLALAQSGQYEAAWRVLTAVNPLPASMGRICYHPCETACNRAQTDGAVNINAVERFLGDEAIRRGWRFELPATDSGKRVLVVGAGPSGLAAAYHLRRLGHAVTLQDGAPAGGGMMRYGIPAYRLPRTILDCEIDRIAATGVAMNFGARVGDLGWAMREGGFDAAFLAVGAQLGRRAGLESSRKVKIIDAVAMLRAVEAGEELDLGRRVIVYGGGNTALDASRTALRLADCEVTIVYRRTRALMPAHDIEVEEALEEGVAIRWLTTIKSVDDDGTVELESMRLDERGFPQPTGHCETIPADTVILALGQDADLDLVKSVRGLGIANGLLHVGPDMMTDAPGIFAGGDMVRMVRTATVGVGDGRNAALHIDAWLRGVAAAEEPAMEPASFDRLHTRYYPPAKRAERPKRNPGERIADFAEIVGDLDESAARHEAARCMSCGQCFDCGICEDVCPEDAVTAAGSSIDIAKCTTCKLCVKECPCGAIAVVPR